MQKPSAGFLSDSGDDPSCVVMDNLLLCFNGDGKTAALAMVFAGEYDLPHINVIHGLHSSIEETRGHQTAP